MVYVKMVNCTQELTRPNQASIRLPLCFCALFLADFFAFIAQLKPGSPIPPMHLRHSRRYCLGYYSDMRT